MASAKDGKPTKRQPRQGTGGRKQRTKKAAARPKAKVDEKAAAKVPKGPNLPASKRMLRDTLMLTRLASGWPISLIAEEAGLTEDAARKAMQKRRDEYPLVLSIDPVKVVEEITLGLQLSIADFESLTFMAAKEGNISAAVGAKKGANDARSQVIQLLQDVGRLPQDLTSMRQLLELREIAQRMVEAIRGLKTAVEDIKAPKAAKEQMLAAADEVERVFTQEIEPPRPTLEAA